MGFGTPGKEVKIEINGETIEGVYLGKGPDLNVMTETHCKMCEDLDEPELSAHRSECPVWTAAEQSRLIDRLARGETLEITGKLSGSATFRPHALIPKSNRRPRTNPPRPGPKARDGSGKGRMAWMYVRAKVVNKANPENLKPYTGPKGRSKPIRVGPPVFAVSHLTPAQSRRERSLQRLKQTTLGKPS